MYVVIWRPRVHYSYRLVIYLHSLYFDIFHAHSMLWVWFIVVSVHILYIIQWFHWFAEFYWQIMCAEELWQNKCTIHVIPRPSVGISRNAAKYILLLTHWGRVTHIRVNKLTIIGSDDGLLPGRRQAITWTNAGILLIRPLGTNFSEIIVKIHIFSLKKMHLKTVCCETAAILFRPQCVKMLVKTLIVQNS